MKNIQPKPKVAPPDDEGPGDPPAPDTIAAEQPAQTQTETDPMARPTHQHRNAEGDFWGEKRSNATHVSTTDPDARLYRKSPGTGAMLRFIGHALLENRSGLIVQGDLIEADGHAERRAALDMVHRHSPGSTRKLTLGADKEYDAAKFVADLRQACVTPHIARKAKYSAIDGRTIRHRGYDLSLRHRKRIEEAFGWAKNVGGMAQTVYRGVERVRSRFILTMAANNLARLPRLLAPWSRKAASAGHTVRADRPEAQATGPVPRKSFRPGDFFSSLLRGRSTVPIMIGHIPQSGILIEP